MGRICFWPRGGFCTGPWPGSSWHHVPHTGPNVAFTARTRVGWWSCQAVRAASWGGCRRGGSPHGSRAGAGTEQHHRRVSLTRQPCRPGSRGCRRAGSRVPQWVRRVSCRVAGLMRWELPGTPRPEQVAPPPGASSHLRGRAPLWRAAVSWAWEPRRCPLSILCASSSLGPPRHQGCQAHKLRGAVGPRQPPVLGVPLWPECPLQAAAWSAFSGMVVEGLLGR